MKIQNVLDPEVGNLNNLAADLQDCFNYCTLCNPSLSSSESAFAGDRYYGGLQGKLKAYEVLEARIAQWAYDCLPAFCDLALLNVGDIDTLEQLTEETRRAMVAIETVCRANEIDGYTGEIIRYYILNPQGNPVFSSVAPCLKHVFKTSREASAYLAEFYPGQAYTVCPSTDFDTLTETRISGGAK